jgi:hypothetical protein
MKFIRSDDYEAKLFEIALCDEKRIIKDAQIVIVYENGHNGKLKAYCNETKTYLQFPRNLRGYDDQRYIGDVVEVVNNSVQQKYYRVMKGSIRLFGSDEVVG